MSYSDYESMKECAADIARDCILKGKSDGWSGKLEDLETLSSILKPYNILYVDDFHGTWELCK